MSKTDKIIFTTHVPPTNTSLHDFRQRALFLVQQFRFNNHLEQKVPITVSWTDDNTIEIDIGIEYVKANKITPPVSDREDNDEDGSIW